MTKPLFCIQIRTGVAKKGSEHSSAHSIWVPQRIKANPVPKSFNESMKNNTAGWNLIVLLLTILLFEFIL